MEDMMKMKWMLLLADGLLLALPDDTMIYSNTMYDENVEME